MNSLKDELDLIEKKSSKSKFFPIITVCIFMVLIISYFVSLKNSGIKINSEKEFLEQETIANDLKAQNIKLLDQIDKLEQDYNNSIAASKNEIKQLKKNHNIFIESSKKEINELENRLKDSQDLISSLKTEINDKENYINDLTIEETDLDNLDAWDAPPPASGPQVKFIPYDDPPRPLYPIEPFYPYIAQQAGIEGQVLVQCFINKFGKVTETIILKGIPNTGLNEAAEDAIKKTQFRPAKQRNTKVGVWITIPVNFSLSD